MTTIRSANDIAAVPQRSAAMARALGHIDSARLFETSCRRFAKRTAVVSKDVRRSYLELLGRTGAFAGGLLSHGVAPGDRVVLMLPNGVAFIEAWWGVVRAGGVVVPVNPRASKDELSKVLDSAAPSAIVLGAEQLAGAAASIRERLPAVRVIQLDAPHAGDTIDFEDLIRSANPISEAQPLGLGAPCAIYYTAGSTGQAKGVLRSHQSVVWGLSMLARRISPSDVLLARAPMAHTGGSLTGPFAVLIAGATLVLPANTSARTILETVEEHRVTHLYVHPTMFAKGMLAQMEETACDLSSLARLHWTAGPLPEPVRAALFARFPKLPLEVTFGMTEASNIACFEYTVPRRPVENAAHCVGYALPGAEIRVVDAAGASLGAGEEGEIVIRTPTAFDGYWRDPEATAAAMTADGWFRTGDIGTLDEDGALYLNGRHRDIIKTGGMTVHPAEVEQALAEHSQVFDAVVFGQPHADWDEAVVAAVSLREVPGVQVDAGDLTAHCRTRLAPYKLPKTIHILPELPRNGSGKVDKRLVMALFSNTHLPA